MENKIEFKGFYLFVFCGVLTLLTALLVPAVKLIFADIGWRWLYILLLSFAVSFCLTPVCSWMAHRFNVLDNPDARKTHGRATPLLGGVAVFVAFAAAVHINAIYSTRLEIILAGAAVLCIIGAADDFREIPAWIKLTAQLACVVLVMSFGIVLRVVPDSFGIWSTAANVVLTVLWVLGITNAMNFFDGMDGLATGLAGLISFFLGVVAFQTEQPFLGWISVAMLGSCAGFLPYNFRQRKNAAIFLGDAGSTVLGFVLACVAVYGNWSEHNPVVALVSPLLIFWLLIFDMVHITVDRIGSGKVRTFREWIDYVGHDHLHHRLEQVLGCKKKSVWFIYFLSFCLGVSAIMLRDANLLEALLLLSQAVILVLLITALERRGRRLTNGAAKPEVDGARVHQIS